MAGRLTAANIHDSVPDPELIRQLPLQVHYVLGDNHYHAPELRAQCELSNRLLVASGRGPYLRKDPGAQVRKIFHKLRHQASAESSLNYDQVSLNLLTSAKLVFPGRL